MSTLEPTHLETRLPAATSMVSWIVQQRMDAIARAVARIDFGDRDSGTGLLLGGRWLLTCHHVLPTLARAQQATAIFGYERTQDGQLSGGVRIALAPAEGFHTSNPGLTLAHDSHRDWSLVRLHNDPELAQFGHADLSIRAAIGSQALARIIQHPGVGEKCSADGRIADIHQHSITYQISTEPGSSGSPVIDMQGQIVALHYCGTSAQHPFHNGGVPIQCIVEDIQVLPNSPWAQLCAPRTAPSVGVLLTRRIAATRLVARHTSRELLGRETELAKLDRAWADTQKAINVFSIIAWGGVGKTALLAHWVHSRFAQNRWQDTSNQHAPQAYFDWTFYDQGIRSDEATHASVASVGAFFQKALAHFGDPQPEQPTQKAARLANLVAAQRTLLVLDGLEPLQYPPNHPQAGQITDPDLFDLLNQLAQTNEGLCVVSSRQPLSEFNGTETGTTPRLNLEDLPLPAAVHLLQSTGVVGSDEDLQEAANDYWCHALSIILLGRYLAQAMGGDVRRRDTIRLEAATELRTAQTRNAWRVLQAYEQWLGSSQGRPADLQALQLVGLFDRPATPDCLVVLRQAPAIPGISDKLVGLGTPAWNILLLRLHEAQLIQLQFPPEEAGSLAMRAEPCQVALDAHPLVREYFAQRLRDSHSISFQAVHSRLFDHLRTHTEYRPDTLAGLQPLYQAVVHGCLAGREQEACEEVYIDRILRGLDSQGYYSLRHFGAYGDELGAVASFFKQPWGMLSERLDSTQRSWLLSQAALCLRSSGRLSEATDLLQEALASDEKLGEYQHSAITASNLSELKAVQGHLGEAIETAGLAISYARYGGDHLKLAMASRTAAANALHLCGAPEQIRRAKSYLANLEEKQQRLMPKYRWLYSMQGFLYCDLILAPVQQVAWRVVLSAREREGDTGCGGQETALLQLLNEAKFRARHTLEWAGQLDLALLSVGLDQLTLARVELFQILLRPNAPECKSMEQAEFPETDLQFALLAVDTLRRSGAMDFLPHGLLTAALHYHLCGDSKAAARCLTQAQQLAERGPMPLHLADVHLHRARLVASLVDDGERQAAYPGVDPREELARARRLIERHRYGRRLPELEDAEAIVCKTPSVQPPQNPDNSQEMPSPH